ncbi:hypothetical protein DPEC_G00225520 [Dallia pectoralis]|uniref:Uncharacterized protein n=1 Tax=Dallia pectoralis TaxID=75939 RepID=A0ACC2G0H8_DALPE|nr:hypothetical protein DPEC_G00225520 [Dallia pectoralis]
MTRQWSRTVASVPLFNQKKRSRLPLTSNPSENECCPSKEYTLSQSTNSSDNTALNTGYFQDHGLSCPAPAAQSQWLKQGNQQQSETQSEYPNNQPGPFGRNFANPYKVGNTGSNLQLGKQQPKERRDYGAPTNSRLSMYNTPCGSGNTQGNLSSYHSEMGPQQLAGYRPVMANPPEPIYSQQCRPTSGPPSRLPPGPPSRPPTGPPSRPPPGLLSRPTPSPPSRPTPGPPSRPNPGPSSRPNPGPPSRPNPGPPSRPNPGPPSRPTPGPPSRPTPDATCKPNLAPQIMQQKQDVSWKFKPITNTGPQKPLTKDSRDTYQTQNTCQFQMPPVFQVKPTAENTMRILTAVIDGMRHWSQLKDRALYLFEIFATLDSAVTVGSHGAKNFLMRDGKETVQCVFYENEMELPRLIRGQVHRCVGNFDRTRDTLICVSVRAALPSEQRTVCESVKASDAEMRSLVKSLSEV